MMFCNTILPHLLKASCERSLQRAQHLCSPFDSTEHSSGETRVQQTAQVCEERNFLRLRGPLLVAALGCGHFSPCSALTDVLCLQRGAGAPEQWEVRGIKVMHQWLPVKEMGSRGGGGREDKAKKKRGKRNILFQSKSEICRSGFGLNIEKIFIQETPTRVRTSYF